MAKVKLQASKEMLAWSAATSEAAGTFIRHWLRVWEDSCVVRGQVVMMHPDGVHEASNPCRSYRLGAVSELDGVSRSAESGKAALNAAPWC